MRRCGVIVCVLSFFYIAIPSRADNTQKIVCYPARFPDSSIRLEIVPAAQGMGVATLYYKVFFKTLRIGPDEVHLGFDGCSLLVQGGGHDLDLAIDLKSGIVVPQNSLSGFAGRVSSIRAPVPIDQRYLEVACILPESLQNSCSNTTTASR